MITKAFSSRVTNWPLFWTMNVLAVGLVLMSGLSHPFVPGLIVVAVVLLAANLTLTSVRVTVGPAGVVVHYGVLGWPRFRYEMSTITTAETGNVPLSRLGGLGVHWSPWRGTRLTIRSGPVLILNRTNRRPITISCNDPEAAVGLINRQPARN